MAPVMLATISWLPIVLGGMKQALVMDPTPGKQEQPTEEAPWV